MYKKFSFYKQKIVQNEKKMMLRIIHYEKISKIFLFCFQNDTVQNKFENEMGFPFKMRE